MLGHARWLGRVAVVVGLGLGTACDDGSDGDGLESQDPCELEDRAEDYRRGLEAGGNDGLVVATLAEAVPAPPAKGDNTWTVQIVDDAGASVPGLQIVTKPFMPDHGHGSSIEPVPSDGAEAGEYVIDEINFVMAGYWETTLELTDDTGAAVDSVMFRFCVRE